MSFSQVEFGTYSMHIEFHICSVQPLHRLWYLGETRAQEEQDKKDLSAGVLFLWWCGASSVGAFCDGCTMVMMKVERE